MLLAEADLLKIHLSLVEHLLVSKFHLLIMGLTFQIGCSVLGEPQLIADIAHSALQVSDLIFVLFLRFLALIEFVYLDHQFKVLLLLFEEVFL